MSERIAHVAGCPQEDDPRNRLMAVAETVFCLIRAEIGIGGHPRELADVLADCLVNEHRTNQQQIVSVLAMMLYRYADLNYKHGHDPRNKEAVWWAGLVRDVTIKLDVAKGMPYL